MRSLVIIIVALVTARTALACPRGARCLIQAPLTSEVSAPAPKPAPDRPLRLRIDHVDARAPWTFDAPKSTDDHAMPWIWTALREQAYAHLPRYRGESDLTFTLSPVVVAGSFDTVPGVGIAGDF